MSCRQTSIGRIIAYEQMQGEDNAVLFSVGWVITQDPDKRMF